MYGNTDRFFLTPGISGGMTVGPAAVPEAAVPGDSGDKTAVAATDVLELEEVSKAGRSGMDSIVACDLAPA
jgi:hypothetical protein